MKEIVMKIAPNGTYVLTTTGFQGKACQQATAEIERLLGGADSDTPTAEARTKPVTLKAKVGGRG